MVANRSEECCWSSGSSCCALQVPPSAPQFVLSSCYTAPLHTAHSLLYLYACSPRCHFGSSVSHAQFTPGLDLPAGLTVWTLSAASHAQVSNLSVCLSVWSLRAASNTQASTCLSDCLPGRLDPEGSEPYSGLEPVRLSVWTLSAASNAQVWTCLSDCLPGPYIHSQGRPIYNSCSPAARAAYIHIHEPC